MKRLLAVNLAIALTASALGTALAAGKAAPKKSEGPKRSTVVEGQVQKSDFKTGVVTMKTGSGSLVFKIDYATKIERGSSDTVPITSVNHGKHVRVSYDVRKGQNIARWVLILPEKNRSAPSQQMKRKKSAQ